MEFPGSIKRGYRNYGNFQGRATRSEFWYWTLFLAIAYSLSLALINEFGYSIGFRIGQGSLSPIVGTLFEYVVYVAIFFGLVVPTISIGVRRLHDIDANGGWLIFGFFTYIFLLTRRSDPLTNRYDQVGETEFPTAHGIKTWQKVVGLSLLMVVIGSAFAIEQSSRSKEARTSAASLKVSSSPTGSTAPNVWNSLKNGVAANRSACASVRVVQTKLFSVMADYGKAAATTDDLAKALADAGASFVDEARRIVIAYFAADLSQTGLALKQARVALLGGDRAAWTRAGTRVDTELMKVNDFCNYSFPVAKP
jgi:uncharacterized membrane protein YhaH (DUF805 family)